MPDDTVETETGMMSGEKEASGAGQWYASLEGIDVKTAFGYSRNEKELRTALRIFFDAIPVNLAAISNLYEDADWEGYTIKVHALKSSSKLVGAIKLSEQARALEAAGKSGDIAFIHSHHEALMADYRRIGETLGPLFESFAEEAADRPVADPALVESVYEEIAAAAKTADVGMLDDIFEEMKEYAMPPEEEERWSRIVKLFDDFDFEGVLAELS